MAGRDDGDGDIDGRAPERPRNRWVAETGGTSGPDYAARFAALAAAGEDVHGEARCLDALLPRAARVLDAGCGTGRVALELARRGHRVVGADLDASMLDQARAADPDGAVRVGHPRPVEPRRVEARPGVGGRPGRRRPVGPRRPADPPRGRARPGR
ncbi:class I SAM-dependent methyltransferase [Pseudokineococcus basanitobsidens]|uniref:Class I SAM-dependent methyltransferase n=1 Tax=Pseudokineococcus basanitobsidens TaxID=1926649 RepID=A0ABU8RIS1_9ACTN